MNLIFNIKKAFSLAEMMVVMLILSIVLAAATPIITKRVIARANETTEQPSSSPPGSIMSFAGTNIPDGWLLCDGKSYSTTGIYSDLFAAIGYNYGGSGINFNVPDLRGRVAMGLDNMGGTSANIVTSNKADILGGKDGEEKHLLTIAEMPSHSHSGYTDSQGEHSHSGYTDAQGNHGGHYRGLFSGTGQAENPGGSANEYIDKTDGIHSHNVTTYSSGTHNHNIYTYAIGSSTSHNVMQPYVALNYIIKY